MGVKSFLKTLGLDALKVATGVAEAIPLLKPFTYLIPKYGSTIAGIEDNVADRLQLAFNIVQDVEQTVAIVTNGASGNGVQKAQAVAARLPLLLKDIELAGGKSLTGHIRDKEKFAVDVQRLAGVLADLADNVE